MALPCRIKRGMGGTWLAVLLLCTGCSQAVMLTHETANGGIVTYLFKEDRGGPMGSPHRREAIQVMEKKCPSGYTVIKDGEMQGYGDMPTVEGAAGDVIGRRWGMQFRCKGV